MKTIAVIPARGGSKGIPAKNIKIFCGKPLIVWTIESTLKSKVDRVIVSTDNEEIKKIALKYGAEVPFIRPKELAIDSIGIEPTLIHAHEWLKNNENYETDAIVLLMPTSPTRQYFHINEALEIFKKTKADSVVAVNETPANHTPYWTLVKKPDGKVTLWDNIPLKKIITRRQEFPLKCYARNDLVYILNPKNLYDKERPNLYGEKVELYVVENSSKYEMDINTPEEWEEAELKFQKIIALKK